MVLLLKLQQFGTLEKAVFLKSQLKNFLPPADFFKFYVLHILVLSKPIFKSRATILDILI